MKKSWMRSLTRLMVVALAVVMMVTMGACRGGEPNKPNGPTDPVGSVTAPTITTFTLDADAGETYGELNAVHKLTIVVTGDCTSQTLTVKKNGQNAVSGTDYEYIEQTKKITFKTAGSYTLTLKAVNGEKSTSKSISVAIEDASATLVFGDDAFGGTWTELKPNIGMALYFDATSHGTPLTYADVTYSIVADGTTAEGAKIVDTGAYETRPYVIATGEGNVKVKIEARDEEDIIDYVKDFNVTQGTESYDNYFKSIYPDSDLMFNEKDIWVDGYKSNGSGDGESNAATTLIATKTGLISSHGDTNQTASLIGVSTDNLTELTVEFDFTLLYVASGNEVYNTLWFTPYEGETSLGNIGINWGDSNNFGSFVDEGVGKNDNISSAVERPSVGETVKVRLQKDGLKTKIALSSDGGNFYNDIISATATSDKGIARVYIWSCDAGDYLIENISVNGSRTVAPTIKTFSLTAADENATYGKVNNAHKLTVDITGDCDTQSLTIKKGSETAASGTDYEYEKTTGIITFKTSGVYTLTLTATNGTKTSTKTISITIADAIQPLAFGDDAFGGTWDKLKPNVGLALYYDATYNGAQLGYEKITYSIVTDGTTATGAKIVSAGAYVNYPYLIAGGTGDIKVKITASVGTNKIEKDKVFKVMYYGSNDLYFKSVYVGTESSGILQDDKSGVWVDGNQRQGTTTLVCTKSGFIVDQASGEYSSVGFHVGGRTEFTVTFDYTLLKEPTGLNSLLINVDKPTGYAGNIWCNWNSGSNFGGAGIDDAISNAVQTVNATAVARPQLNQTVRFKIECKNMTLSLSISTDGGASYNMLAQRLSNGLAVQQMFLAALDANCGLFENFTLT